MSFLEIRDFLTERTLKGGYFQGTVVDTLDPEQASRIKVKLDNLTDEIDKESLPWYYIEQYVTSSPNSKTTIPKNGSRVIVKFEQEDIMNGIVTTSIVSQPPKLS